MQRFTSKPVEIEAWQLVEHPADDQNPVPYVIHPEGFSLTFNGEDWVLWVEKSQANAVIHPGDWVIREPDGSGFYPCTAAIFAARYEVVEVCGDPCGWGAMCATQGRCEDAGQHGTHHHGHAKAMGDPESATAGEHTWPNLG